MTNPTTITAAPGLPFVDVVRQFDAPAAAVFRAHTDPHLFSRWTGTQAMRMDSLELDPRPGGRWGYTFHGEGDTVYGFSGVFHAVQPSALIIQTFEFNLAPGQVGISTTRFEETGQRTRLWVREVYPSVEARDAALASGMEHGVSEGYERLEKILAELDTAGGR